MSKCQICNEEKLESTGCKVDTVFIDGVEFERIPCGDENDLLEVFEGGRCHDCGALYGHYHHFNCDSERCPKCFNQLIGCDCDIEFEDYEE